MHSIARQILQCPYQGVSRQLYLEGNVLTLMGLITAQEVEIQGSNRPFHDLKPEVIDRIHHATGFLRNGLREAGRVYTRLAPNIERIEVLLGLASVVYGTGNPGGTINIVTKQPLRDPFYAADATIGNYDFYQGAIDLSEPLNDSRSLLYRFNAGYQNSNSFVNFYLPSILEICSISIILKLLTIILAFFIGSGGMKR